MCTLGRFEGRVDVNRPLGVPWRSSRPPSSTSRYATGTCTAGARWFLLSCVVLPWAVEQYDAAPVPAS